MSEGLWKIEGDVFFPLGSWRLDDLVSIGFDLGDVPEFKRVDLSLLSDMDTYGALLIADLMKERDVGLDKVFEPSNRYLKLLEMVFGRERTCGKPQNVGVLEQLYSVVETTLLSFLSFFDFLGRLLIHAVLHFRDFEIRVFLRDIETSGLKAIPVIGTLSFLIGVVISYQSAAQLARFGANIFIVDLVSISVVRELSPLIVAVLMSGRSASSYTATIGLMKVNDEIDALEVMGISPFSALVLPRILSLTIITPFMVVFADLVGIFGGALVAKFSLGIEFSQFASRLGGVLAPHHFWSGVIKAPVFGLFVATVGTWKGMLVEKRAESIGFRVIESVVTSIFGVLVIDAIFSVVFRWLKI